MNDRALIKALGTSLALHLGLLPLGGLLLRAKLPMSVAMPVELVEVPRTTAINKPEVAPPVPAPKAVPVPKRKAEPITAPKLLSEPKLFEAPPSAATPKEAAKEPEKIPEAPAKPSGAESAGAAKAPGGARPSEGEGSAAGAGGLFGRGDVAVVGGSGVSGGGGGRGTAGLGSGARGDGAGGSGDGSSAIARPLGGYQVRPRYPESARRAGVQGTTLLKIRVLENGRVGDVLVEQSAGHRDLDGAAVDAVKKWLFEPARQGKEPIAVWVILPVKFELQR